MTVPPEYLDYQPKWSNCLFWTARQLHHRGGYGLFRRGHNGVPFHTLWIPEHAFEALHATEVYSYEPLRALRWQPGNWRSDLLVFFRGHIVEGDCPMQAIPAP